MKPTMKFIATLMRTVIRVYQLLIKPVLPAGGCRFHPNCSEFAYEAIGLHGAFLGGWLAVKRIFRCHPWGGDGADPVPPRPGNESAKGFSNLQERWR